MKEFQEKWPFDHQGKQENRCIFMADTFWKREGSDPVNNWCEHAQLLSCV